MNKYYEQIQDFVEGHLEEDAKNIFIQQMDRDEELKNEVALRKEIYEALAREIILEDDTRELKKVLEEKIKIYFNTDQQITVKKKSVFKRWSGALAVAATLAVIFTITGVFNRIDYSSVPLIPDYATRATHQEENYIQAVNAFNSKHYEEAITLLHELKDNSYFSTVAIYYTGLSYLKLNNFNQARIYLEEIANGESVYKYEASYFLGYSLYKLNDTEAALTYLKTVPENSGYYKKSMKLSKKIGFVEE